MSNQNEFVCGNCGYPAKNSSIFMDEKGFNESIICPKCNADSNIILKKK